MLVSYINNEFRCIVSVDNNKINEQEPPFLNRFEKHIISFEYLLSKELIHESEIIKSILEDMILYDKNIYRSFNYSFNKLLINSNIDEIQGLFYQAFKEGKNIEDIIDYILNKLSLTLPQDIIINMRFNGFRQKYPKYFKKIVESYGEADHSNFINFLCKINNYHNVVYTFTNNLDKIKNIKNIKVPLIEEIINEENIKVININSLNSENELESLLDDLFNNNKYKICIIKFMPNEGFFMNYNVSNNRPTFHQLLM